MIPNRLSDLAAGALMQHWMVLGPFVIKTGGHFEREYLYERDRILEVDYLAGEGGEASLNPEPGRTYENIGLGPKRLAWRDYASTTIWGTHVAGDIIYETVQRNCVIYAAAEVVAETAGLALLDAYHSGMKMWVNGELVFNEPYGPPKGVRLSMPSQLVRLKQGRNLFLFKIRPGHIADGIDFCIHNVHLAPLASKPGFPIAVGRLRPMPYFTGTIEKPRQVVEAALVNTSGVALNAHASLASTPLSHENGCDIVCEPGKAAILRLSLLTPREAAGKPVQASLQVRLDGDVLEVPLEYSAAEPPKYDGTSMALTSFHFDTTYHEEQRVYAMGAFDIVRDYCRIHRADPNFRSTLSEVDYLKPYFDMFPEDRATLMEVFREKRSNPDVMYNQPNEQNCGGEALVRNFLYGQLFHERVLGDICHCYGPGDVFGHPNQLSQIVRKSRCMGVTWDKYIFNFPPFFQHLSLDGSSVPHKRGEATWDEVHDMGLSVKAVNIDQTPPTDWHKTLMPTVMQATYLDLMTAILEQSKEDGSGRAAHLPVTSRDMSLYHAATAMSRIDLKIANRLGENVLLTAERFATVANLLGAKYPEKALDKAWRQILCGQHHDSITGTHNEISFVDLMNSYREVLELGTDVLNRSLQFLGKAIDSGNASGAGRASHPLLVFNPLAWERTDVVRAAVRPAGLSAFAIQDHHGRSVPFEVREVKRDGKGAIESATVTFVAEKMPSLGYRAYRIVPSPKTLPEPKRIEGVSIENEFYRVTVDPARGGGVISLYDKQAKRETINKKTHHVANELAIIEEVPDREETQHEFYTTGLKMFSGEQAATVEIENGPVTTTLRSRYAMGEVCGVVQEITLIKGVKRIDFQTTLLDYQGEDNLFCITFPTNLRGAAPIFDERFGVVTRNDSKNYLDFRTHRQLMFSDCAVYAANKWMEYGVNGVLKMGRNKHALGMVGLITPNDKADVEVAEQLQRTLIKKGVTCTPWHDKDGPHWGSYQPHMDEDLLFTRFRISMGSRRHNAYTKKLLAAQPQSVRKAFEFEVKKKGHAFLFVKDAELHDPSWPALPVLIIEADTPENLAAAVSDMLAEFPATATITLPESINMTGEKHPMDNYGIAVLNEGTYANSIEKGGVICMMLTHTCRWYGGTNNFPEGYLVPENKDQVFRYAVYPHAGDWRQADTQHVGHAFNYPLLARETEPAKNPVLPPESAFLEVAPKNLILAAMKPYGNPIASFEKNAACDASNSIMLRLYDTEGVDAEGTIHFASGIESAWTANLLEEREQDISVHDGRASLYVAPFSIETVGFKPGPLPDVGSHELIGPEAEPVQPVWVRAWEHDAESMPMGYEAVVCSLSRQVREEDGGRTLHVRLNAVNDYTDASVAVAARILVPEGWRTDWDSVTFEMTPLGHQIEELRVTRPDASVPGQIKLRYDYDGQTFQDVLEIDACFDLKMEARNGGDVITVIVSNPTAETIEGEVSMVTPTETWSRDLVGPYALLDISPRTQGVSVSPGESVTLTFAITQAAERSAFHQDSYWAVAKLMSNGRITLKRCDNTPPRRMMHDGKWRQMYTEKTKRLYKREWNK